jgi:phosphatidate cytidylyltransferase
MHVVNGASVPAPAEPAIAAAATQPPGRTRRGGRWGDLRLRVLSALALAPPALACLWLGGLAWLVLIALVAAGLAYEWMRLWPPQAGRAICAAGLGLIVVAAFSLLWVRGDAVTGRADMLFVLLVVWASDIGAYLVGRIIGGRRLWPSVSPGKTWAGAAGGLAASALIGALVAVWLGDAAPIRAVGAAVVLSLVAQAGDLLESAVKRRRGVKDTGRLIPGHGGLLDRLDGMMAAVPVAALLALAAGRGVVFWQ